MEYRRPSNEDPWLLSFGDLMTNLLIFFVILLSASEISEVKMQQITKSLSGKSSPMSLGTLRDRIDAEIRELDIEHVVGTELSDRGLELRLNSGVVFDSGEGVIRPELETTMDLMLQTLVPYAERYRFAVEGHTDSRPIAPGGRYRSNWELSTARANAVRQRLEAIGLARDRVMVEGYADTKVLDAAELEGLAEPEQLARHRRVVVRVY